ncbi:MAG: M67 family metallopeptidase [Nitrospirae bacterium]|nr:M67 family metallopeptidase [Nitrospirota bacterium]MBI3351182.1 M67 family metallopeptidase [Nitrospirota bacterium]
MLKIPKAIQEALFIQALQEDPLECCGLLAGKDERVTHHYQVKNADKSSTTYLMEPREQLWAFTNMRHNQLDLLAIYHSHTHTPAYPSATDTRLAYYPDSRYLIISLLKKDAPHMRIFRMINEEVKEESFDII